MTKSNKNTVLISIGCNINRDKQIKKVRECLSGIFPDIHFTRSLTSPACPGDGVYSNMLAELKTELPEQDLVTRLKQLEQEMGDSAEQRKLGKVMMDLDILRYNNEKRHEDDWERHYIKKLLRYTMRVVVILMTVAFSHSFSYASSFQEQNKTSDADLLGSPVRVIISPKTLDRGVIEIATRDKSIKEDVAVENAQQRIKEIVAALYAAINDKVPESL